MTSLKRIFIDKDSASAINRLFSTAMGVFILSSLISAIGPTIDGIVVGSYYQLDEVAAIGLTSFLLVGIRTLAASIIATGSNVVVSRMIGAGDKKSANKAFSLSIVLALTISCLMALVCIIFSNQIAIMLGARGALAHLMKPTSDYLIGYCIGLPFYAIYMVLMPYLKMDGNYNFVTLSTVAMVIVDIAADLYVVKYINGGLFMIGLATTAGHVIACLIVLSHFLLKKSLFHFSLEGLQLQQGIEMIRSGVTTGITKLSTMIYGILINNMLAVFTASEVIAAFGVGNQVLKFCFCFWVGAASTLASFASMLIGEEDREALASVQKTALKNSLRITCLAAVLIFVFSGQIAMLFIKNGGPSVISMAAESIRFFALSMPFNVAAYCFQFYLVGIKRRPPANIYSFVLELGIPVPLTLLMLVAIGYRGAWVAKPIVGILCVLIAYQYIRRQKGRTFEEKMLMLPDDFGFEAGKELSFSADSMTDVMIISKTGIAFAEENGFDINRARLLSLAVEEMAGNIVQHGFKDGKPHIINIRMLIKNDEIILRLRDDCRRFDPVDKYRTELQFDENPENRVAIKMMIKLAKEIKYTGLYGVNNLIIRI